MAMWLFSVMKNSGCRPDAIDCTAHITTHLHTLDKAKALEKARGADILAAMDLSILDGVDVLSLYLCGDSAPYYHEMITFSLFLDYEEFVIINGSFLSIEKAYHVKGGNDSEVAVLHSFITMFMKYNANYTAKQLRDQYSSRRLYLYNALASNFVHQGIKMETLGVLNLMIDRFAVLSAISSCSQLRNLQWEKSCQCYILSTGFESWDNENMHLVMELCEGSDLFDRIIARGHYMERAAATKARTIVVVVMMYHSNRVMHRDIKSETFLIANKKREFSSKGHWFFFICVLKTCRWNDGEFWSKLLSLADEEQSHDGDSHGLTVNIVVLLNKFSGFKKYKVSDNLFFDRRRQTTIRIEDSFFEMVSVRPGGVYTKAQLQKERKALCDTISCAKSKWQSVDMFRCINVGLMVQSNPIEMDTEMSHMTNKVKLEYYMSLEKDYKWRRDRACLCLLRTPVYVEVMLILRDQGKEALAENVLKNGSIDMKIVQEAEDEIKKLNALKSSKMMKLVFLHFGYFKNVNMLVLGESFDLVDAHGDECFLKRLLNEDYELLKKILLELSLLDSKVERHLKIHLEDKVSSKRDGIDKVVVSLVLVKEEFRKNEQKIMSG